jgi:ABC-type nitrate/sulfonate/bicarbonate transport system substrate-binding protein
MGSNGKRAAVLAVVLLGAMLLGACSGSSGGGGGGDGGAGGTPELKVGFPTTPDFDDLMTLAAVERLKQAGWKIEPVFFNDPETAFAALARNDTQIGFGAAAAALESIQSGAKIKLVAQQQGGAGWSLVARNDITACDQLANVRFALNSTGGATTGYAKYWIAQECSPDAAAKIKPLYIPGSENRAAALTAGQIDATLLTPGDIAVLEGRSPSAFHTVVDFSKTDLGQLNSSVIAVNEGYLGANRDTVIRFLATAMKVYREASADPAILREYAEKQQIQWSDKVVAALENQFASGEFKPELTITEQTVAFTIDFFTKYGGLEEGLQPAQIMDAGVRTEAAARPGDAA